MMTDRMCKDGCGRSLAGYHMRRQYHDECTCPEAVRMRNWRVYETARLARKKLGGTQNQHRSEGGAIEGRARPKLCKSCMNYSDRRPASGCPGCKLPYGEEKLKTIVDYLTPDY